MYGPYLYKGQSCAVFTVGPVAIVVNERADAAIAKITDGKLEIVKPIAADPRTNGVPGGWDVGLTAVSTDAGLEWDNGCLWERA